MPGGSLRYCGARIIYTSINVTLDPENPYADYLSLQGTSTGERANRFINTLIKDVGWQSVEMADKRLWLRVVTRYNFDMDERLEKPCVLCSLGPWALLKLLPQLSPAYKDLFFPPDCEERYFEPIGIYGRCRDWLKVQQDIDC